MKKSNIISVFVALVIGTVLGYALSHQSNSVVANLAPTGTTNSTAKVLSIKMDLSSTAGTTTSILIPQDFAVANSFAFCTSLGYSSTTVAGLPLASLLIKGATTSTAVTGNLADYNTNYATQLVISTTTSMSFASSTSESALVGNGRYLPSAAYYTFSANATNTAQCTVGVNVVAI